MAKRLLYENPLLGNPNGPQPIAYFRGKGIVEKRKAGKQVISGVSFWLEEV